MIELVPSSARVTSGSSLTTEPIDRIPGTPGLDKNLSIRKNLISIYQYHIMVYKYHIMVYNLAWLQFDTKKWTNNIALFSSRWDGGGALTTLATWRCRYRDEE